MLVGGLTCALLHFQCDLKAAKINVQFSLIWEIMLSKFELIHNVTEVSKNISQKVKGRLVDHSTVTRWIKKFCLGFKNLENQARSGRPKNLDSKFLWKPWRQTLRLSGKFGIQCSLLASQPQYKYLERPNCASHYQNIATLLTHLSIFAEFNCLKLSIIIYPIIFQSRIENRSIENRTRFNDLAQCLFLQRLLHYFYFIMYT